MQLEIWEFILLCWLFFGIGSFFGVLIFKKIEKGEPYTEPRFLLSVVVLMMLPALPVIGIGVSIVMPILNLVRRLRKIVSQKKVEG